MRFRDPRGSRNEISGASRVPKSRNPEKPPPVVARRPPGVGGRAGLLISSRKVPNGRGKCSGNAPLLWKLPFEGSGPVSPPRVPPRVPKCWIWSPGAGRRRAVGVRRACSLGWLFRERAPGGPEKVRGRAGTARERSEEVHELLGAGSGRVGTRFRQRFQKRQVSGPSRQPK